MISSSGANDEVGLDRRDRRNCFIASCFRRIDISRQEARFRFDAGRRGRSSTALLFRPEIPVGRSCNARWSLCLYAIDHLIDKQSGTWWLVWAIAYLAVPASLFKVLKSQAVLEWQEAHKQAKRDSVVRARSEQAEAERQRQRADADRELREDNARYAPIGERTMSPSEISEAARRVAEELKRG